MATLGREQFYKIAGVKQHSEFERYLAKIVLDKPKREQFYRDLLAINKGVYTDTFKAYFEEYAAERKSNKQDYTPDTVSSILAAITRNDAKKCW